MLPVSLVVASVYQADFLVSEGWRPIARNPVQWPSIMLLGPGGWALGVVFVVAGALMVFFGFGWWSATLSVADRWVVGSAVVMGLALAGVAIPPDLGPARAIHDAVYPLIPLSWLVFALAHLRSVRGDRGWVTLRKVGVFVVVPLFVLSWLATSIDPIAQLARYLLFATQLVWIGTIALKRASEVGRARCEQ